MAKNKLKGQKSRNVFHIANQKTFKVKNKAKPVTTNLKKGCRYNCKDLNEKALILQSWEILGAASSKTIPHPQMKKEYLYKEDYFFEL
ncbi:ribosomal biogenesis factor isoform X2 [Psammomys obesus]|uniref:ribosomal biogenesis factor isoform X2 n=1 Tax=Psammomys obesus TaxID=48139 RepID=UPI002453490E|nr:ribosomal biogenesis factor isoform X2 [Psammomys obesus]